MYLSRPSSDFNDLGIKVSEVRFYFIQNPRNFEDQTIGFCFIVYHKSGVFLGYPVIFNGPHSSFHLKARLWEQNHKNFVFIEPSLTELIKLTFVAMVTYLPWHQR